MTVSAFELEKDRKVHGRALGARTVDTIIVALAVIPLLLTQHLPLNDLPNHLARQIIFRDLAASPILQTFYEIHWALVPNLALEIFVWATKHLMCTESAVRVFCIATIMMLFFGTKGVNRALAGPKSRIYRVAPLLFYGAPFQFGFLSFCFGIGLALVIFWLYLRLRPASWLALAAIFAPCGAALLLCHLVAFGVFAVAVGCIELDRAFADAGGWSRRLISCVLIRQVRVASFLLPTFFVFKFLSPVSEASGVRFSTLHQKAEGVAALTMFSSPATELPLLLLGIGGLIAALVAGVVRANRLTIIMAAVFTIIWLALPRVVLGGGYVDLRVLWAASFFLIAGLVPGATYDRYAARFGALFGTLILARVALIASFWLSWEPTLSTIDNALTDLPLGTRLMVVIGDLQSVSASRRPSLDHVAAYAVARRHAFEPNLFASFSGQILHFRKPYDDLWTMPPPTELSRLEPQYNYLLVIYPEVARVDSRLLLRCRQSGPKFALLEILSSNEPGASDLGCLRPKSVKA